MAKAAFKSEITVAKAAFESEFADKVGASSKSMKERRETALAAMLAADATPPPEPEEGTNSDVSIAEDDNNFPAAENPPSDILQIQNGQEEQDIEEGVSNILKITVTKQSPDDKLGFKYVRQPSTGHYFITSVSADGLCGQTGLQKGQEMLEINGISLRGMEKEGVRNLLSSQSGRFTITVTSSTKDIIISKFAQNGQEEQDIEEGVSNILKITDTKEQSPDDKLGFKYVQEPSTGRYFVFSVAADGLCGQTGLQKGQEMLEINGISLRGMEREGVRNLLLLSSKSGREVTITVTSSTKDIIISKFAQNGQEECRVSNILKITDIPTSEDHDPIPPDSQPSASIISNIKAIFSSKQKAVESQIVEFKLDDRYPLTPRELNDLAVLAQETRSLVLIVRDCPVLGLDVDGIYAQCWERYVNYWLPLVCRYQTNHEILAPPLDCAWLWYVHMLDPVAYNEMCQAKFGQLLIRPGLQSKDPSKCYVGSIYPSVQQYLKTQTLWQKMYPDLPFEVVGRLENIKRAAGRKAYEELIFDGDTSRLGELLRNTPIIESCQRQKGSFSYQVALSHYDNPSFLRRALQRYVAFLTLKREHANAFLVPTYDIDLIWHTHMALPDRYAADTVRISGKLVPHDDSVVDRSVGSKLQSSYKMTLELWGKRFQNAPYQMNGCMWRGDPPLLLPASLRQTLTQSCLQAPQRTQVRYSTITIKGKEMLQLQVLPGNTYYMCPADFVNPVREGPAPGCTWECVQTKRLELRNANNEVVCIARRDVNGEFVKSYRESRSETCFVISYDGEDWALVKAKWKGLRVGVGTPGVRVRGSKGRRGNPGHFSVRYIPLRGATKRAGLGSITMSRSGHRYDDIQCPHSLLTLRHKGQNILQMHPRGFLMNIQPSFIPPLLMTALVLENLHDSCRFRELKDALEANANAASSRSGPNPNPGSGAGGCGGCGGCSGCGGCGGGGCGGGGCGGGGGGCGGG